MTALASRAVSGRTLGERIQGRASIRILREFVTNSGIFPIFNMIRVATQVGPGDFAADPANWLILLAGAIQAVVLGWRTEHRWWQRALGNLVGPALYTAIDLVIEGPGEFVRSPYHWVYWGYAVCIALLYMGQALLPRLEGGFIIVVNLLKVLLFPALYGLSELGQELSGLTWNALATYYWSSSGHSFIVTASLLFGLLLGLSEAEITRTTGFLRRVAGRLRVISEWSLDAALLEEGVEDTAALGQRRVRRAILFMDIRGFTRWSESKGPETVVSMLNEFYQLAERLVVEGGGHKPHFIGDEVMTWFENPINAVETARRLQRDAGDLLSRYGLAGGMGLHLGEVVEGMLGSESTRSYNIIGDTVNTASRLCAAAQPGEALISGALAADLALIPELGQPREIQAKGKQEPIVVYPL